MLDQMPNIGQGAQTFVQVTRCSGMSSGVWILDQASRFCSRCTDISLMTQTPEIPNLHLFLSLAKSS